MAFTIGIDPYERSHLAAVLDEREQPLDELQVRAATDDQPEWLGAAMVKHYKRDDADIGLLMAAVQSAFDGMDVDAFSDEVLIWFRTASHPKLERPFREQSATRWLPSRSHPANGQASQGSSGATLMSRSSTVFWC
jgi:hypothetical protein